MTTQAYVARHANQVKVGRIAQIRRLRQLVAEGAISRMTAVKWYFER